MSTLTDGIRNLLSARTLMLLMAVGMVVAGVILGLRGSTANMAPLYTGLSLEDSAKIVAELEKNGTPYELLGNGSEIMVPNDRVLRMRMNIAQIGLPAAGSVVGYEIFDRSDALSSSSLITNINMLRALEGELSRTIASIAYVDSARVHLVMPKHELFAREKDKPSASVTIKMRGGHSLERSEVTAVTHLIASAVPGLEPSKVTVIDSLGHLLAKGDGGEQNAATDNALDFRLTYENKLQKDLEDLIEKVIGSGKVRVQVSADMNFDRVVTNSEKYDPDGQVARSVQTNTERDNAQDRAGKEGTSAASNVPQAAAGAESGSSSNHLTERTDETTNYEVSKTVQNHVSEGGTINKLSVAVLVDGNYTTDSAGKSTYTPRSDEELKKIKTLVNSAIGYSDKRGDTVEVVNMQFTQNASEIAEESFFSRFKLEMQSIIQTLIIAVVAIMAILLVLRPAVNQLISQSASDRVAGELAALENPGAPGGAARLPGATGEAGAGQNEENDTDRLIDIANVSGGMKASTVKKVTDIVEQNPEETMNVIRKWVTAP